MSLVASTVYSKLVVINRYVDNVTGTNSLLSTDVSTPDRQSR